MWVCEEFWQVYRKVERKSFLSVSRWVVRLHRSFEHLARRLVSRDHEMWHFGAEFLAASALVQTCDIWRRHTVNWVALSWIFGWLCGHYFHPPSSHRSHEFAPGRHISQQPILYAQDGNRHTSIAEGLTHVCSEGAGSEVLTAPKRVMI